MATVTNDVPGHQEFQAKQDRAAEQPSVLFSTPHRGAEAEAGGAQRSMAQCHSNNHHCDACRIDGLANKLNRLLELHWPMFSVVAACFAADGKELQPQLTGSRATTYNRIHV